MYRQGGEGGWVGKHAGRDCRDKGRGVMPGEVDKVDGEREARSGERDCVCVPVHVCVCRVCVSRTKNSGGVFSGYKSLRMTLGW